MIRHMRLSVFSKVIVAVAVAALGSLSVSCNSTGQSSSSTIDASSAPSISATPGLTYGLLGQQSGQEPPSGWPQGGSVVVETPSQMSVSILVKNDAAQAVYPVCEVDLFFWNSFSLNTSPKYLGGNNVRDGNALAPGQAWKDTDIVSVPNGGANHVNAVSVTCWRDSSVR